MKVNVEQRAIAKQVMETGCPYGERPDTTTEKANMYGLVAHHLSRISLAEVRSIVMKDRYESVGTIGLVVGCALREQFSEQREWNDRQSLDDAVLERRDREGGYHVRSLPNPGGNRLGAGVEAAIEFMTYTLRTAQYASETIEPITLQGLLASQRVTFQVAMIHRTATRLITPEYGVLMTPERALSNQDQEQVYSERVIDYESGLGLNLKPEIQFPPLREDELDPLIGCPATLIKGFIRNFHGIGVEAAVRSNLIPLKAD